MPSFKDIFFKLLKFIIGQRGNLGLELRVDFQIDHTHTPLSLLLRLFFLPEKGRNILLCGFQFEQFLFCRILLVNCALGLCSAFAVRVASTAALSNLSPSFFARMNFVLPEGR